MADCRPRTAAVAAVVIAATVALAIRGLARTTTADDEGGTAAPLLGPRVRAWYRGLMAPLEDGLAAAGVHPDALTWASLVVSALAGWAFAVAAVFLAGWLTIVAGTLDILDGGLARRTGRAGRRGALVDSVVDRWAEFLTFLGVGALFVSEPAMLAVVALAAFGSQMVSYVRARAEGLGLEMRVGRAQRPERYVLLGCGAWVSGLASHLACSLTGAPTHLVLRLVLVALAAGTVLTAVERARWAVAALAGQEREG